MRNAALADRAVLMEELRSNWCYHTDELDGETLLSLPISYPWAEWLQMEVNALKTREKDPLRRILKMDFPRGVLLYGDPGNGRHTVGNALLKSLRCPCLYLNGFLLAKWEETVFCDCLNDFVEQFESSTGGPALSIFVEEMSQCSWAYALLDTLNDLLREEEGTLFCVILEDKYRIPDMLRNKFLQCCFRNPNRDERLRYLNGVLGDPIVLLEKMDMEDLAEKTEEFSYCELNSLVHLMRLKQRNNYFRLLNGRDVSMLTESEIRNELQEITISRADIDKLFRLLERPAEKTAAVPRMIRYHEPARAEMEEKRHRTAAEYPIMGPENNRQPAAAQKTQSEYFEEFQKLSHDEKESMAAEMYRENHSANLGSPDSRTERLRK